MFSFISRRMWVNVLNLMLLCPVLGSLTYDLGQNSQTMTRSTFICKSEPDVDANNAKGVLSSPLGLNTRSFLLDEDRRWDRGIVPYTIDHAFSQHQVAKIKQAIEMISSASCVKWVPRQNQDDYVQFVRTDVRDMCNSKVGRLGGPQDLNLGDECFNDNGFQGAIPHEMLHAIGFIHEQQRLDRDCFVKVAHDAAVEKKFDYGITPNTDTQFPYDFGSIMHYGSGRELAAQNGESLGNLGGKLTDLDIMKLNNMYCGGPTFCQVQPKKCEVFKKAQEQCRLNFNG